MNDHSNDTKSIPDLPTVPKKISPAESEIFDNIVQAEGATIVQLMTQKGIEGGGVSRGS